MPMERASNSILAKTRAKYGKRLTVKNYRDMITLSTVSEVATYLKNYTRYSSVLSNVKEVAVNRGYLEKKLKEYNLSEISQLCKFEKSIGERLFEFVVEKAEIDELMEFVSRLAAGHPQDYILDVSSVVNSFSDIDFLSLSKVRTFWQLVEALRPTKFGKVFTSFPASPTGVPDIPMIEATLDKELYRHTFSIIDDCFDGESRDELKDILSIQAELLNLRRIYRSKKYYGVSSDLLRSQLINVEGYISKKNLERLLYAKESEEVKEIILTTKYKKYMAKYNFDDIDYFASHVLQEICNRKIRFSPHPAVVMLCYIIYTENECENITNIIEGVRYSVSPEEIRALLIDFDKEGA